MPIRALRLRILATSASLPPVSLSELDSGAITRNCPPMGMPGPQCASFAALAKSHCFLLFADFMWGCRELLHRREPIAPFWHNQPRAAHALDCLKEIDASRDRPPAVA